MGVIVTNQAGIIRVVSSSSAMGRCTAVSTTFMSNVHLPFQLSSLNIKAKDHDRNHDIELGPSLNVTSSVPPSLWGVPLKYLSLVV